MGPLATLACEKKPFFFLTDFLADHIEVYPIDQLEDADIAFSFNPKAHSKHKEQLRSFPIDYAHYAQSIEKIKAAIKAGKTYVLNFTQATPIETDLSLEAIYEHAHAKYKLRYKDRFVCFSPETFVRIENNTISTYPMKGTIDASIENAAEKILNDPKELAEHTMIVDLLRNDLSMVAKQVTVEKFRYIETLETGNKKLLQISSKITGQLPIDWNVHLDQIIKTLLPAGSISGAPKKSTVDHILRFEDYERGFYTGIMGYYDGDVLETAVMIRFIEQTPAGLVYKSGGGITIESSATDEYQEMLDKIYIP